MIDVALVVGTAQDDACPCVMRRIVKLNAAAPNIVQRIVCSIHLVSNREHVMVERRIARVFGFSNICNWKTGTLQYPNTADDASRYGAVEPIRCTSDYGSTITVNICVDIAINLEAVGGPGV